MDWQVTWDKKLGKDLKKIPHFIVEKFRAWVVAVETDGLLAVRKLPSFHDEPLKGKRFGQRSIRLNKAYRAIYIEGNDGLCVVQVIEVNKHDY